MRYNEKEEIEVTGEWLLRISEAGFSEELMYVPSQLTKLGVAPIDVVDWIQGSETQEIPVVPVCPVAEETGALVLNYDVYGAWEWADPIEKMVEEAFALIFDLEPDLPDFNELALLSRQRRRTRGKKARTASMSATQPRRVAESMSEKTVGTSA